MDNQGATLERSSTKGSTERSGRLMTRSFLLVLSATFAYFVAIGILLPALPLFVQGPLAGDTVSVGVAVGSFSLAALLLRPWAGRLGDRRGRRVLVVGGAALVAASAVGYLVATSLPVLAVLRLVAGAGEALFFIGVLTTANDLAPDQRRAEAMSLFSLAPYAGLAVGPVVSEAMLDHHGFAAVWAVTAGSALVAMGLGLMLPETRSPMSPAPGRTRVLHPAGVLPGAVLLTIFVGFAGFNAFVALYARELGLAGAQIPFLTFAGVLLAIRSVGARVPDRLGVARAALFAVSGAAAGLTIVGLWATTAGLLAGSVIFATGQALAFPALMALAIRRAPASERSSVVGTLSAFVDLAFGAGPIALGAVAAVLGLRATFLVAGACAAAGLLLLHAGRQQLRTVPLPS